MEKDDIKKIILTEFPDIRPSLIKHRHDELIQDYKQQYHLIHKKYPSKQQLDYFCQILLINKTALKDADAILDGLIDKLIHEAQKERRKKLLVMGIVNTVFFVMLLNICFNFIGLYLESAGIDILNGYNPLTFPNVINAIFVLCASIAYYLRAMFQKEK